MAFLESFIVLGLVFWNNGEGKLKGNERNMKRNAMEGNENENEKMKNEKCLFSNTQEFLHNIFIKSLE